VNNFRTRGRVPGYSRGPVSILGGTTGGHFRGPGGHSSRSLIEQSRARRPEKPAESATGIRPGNRGKGGRSWCVRPLRGASRDRHVSPVPLDGVATVPVLRLRNCAARREFRNRVRAESGPGSVSGPAPMQLPRGLRLLLHDQSAAFRPGRSPTFHKARLSNRRGAQRADRGGERRGMATTRQPSELGAVPQTGITQLQVERSLRGKRSDPSHGANAPPSAVAVPVVKVPERMFLAGVPAPVRRACHRQVAAEPGVEASLDRSRA
jgi:hypothetical protein